MSRLCTLWMPKIFPQFIFTYFRSIVDCMHVICKCIPLFVALTIWLIVHVKWFIICKDCNCRWSSAHTFHILYDSSLLCFCSLEPGMPKCVCVLYVCRQAVEKERLYIYSNYLLIFRNANIFSLYFVNILPCFHKGNSWETWNYTDVWGDLIRKFFIL